MSTAYNLQHKEHRARTTKVGTVLDPGSGGTIRLGQKHDAICIFNSTGARTLEPASYHASGVKVLCISQADGASVNSVPLNDGSHVEFLVTLDESGANQWVVVGEAVAASRTLQLPFDPSWGVHDAPGSSLPAVSGNDDLGILDNTYGTNAPVLNNTEATPSSSTRYARKQVVVPADYKAGTNLTLDLVVTEQVAATTATLDVECYRQASPAADICATAAIDVTGNSATVNSFTLTGTNVVAGDVLDIRVAVTLDDSSATPDYDITEARLDYTAG